MTEPLQTGDKARVSRRWRDEGNNSNTAGIEGEVIGIDDKYSRELGPDYRSYQIRPEGKDPFWAYYYTLDKIN